MPSFIVRRLLLALLVIFGVTVITFGVARLVPADQPRCMPVLGQPPPLSRRRVPGLG